MLSKETFVLAIKEIKKAEDYQNALNNVFEEYCADGFIVQPDCSIMLMQVLEESMGVKLDDNGYSPISYFCYDLGYGELQKPGLIKDKDGNDVEIESAEELYDFIVRGETTE